MFPVKHSYQVTYRCSRSRIKETRKKETFGYKKHFHYFAFMQGKLSTLIGQLMKETVDKRNSFLPPSEFLLSKFDCGSIVKENFNRLPY